MSEPAAEPRTEPAIGSRIVPEETPLTAPYWAAARAGRVLLQRCADCGVVWHPPAPTCPAGPTHRVEWVEASGRAVLRGYTSVRHAVHATVADRVPYLVALVELAEGPLFVCSLTDVEEGGLVNGLPLTLAPGPTPGGLALPVARPAGGAGAAGPAHPA
jgi:uncharacterized OB-fold protein